MQYSFLSNFCAATSRTLVQTGMRNISMCNSSKLSSCIGLYTCCSRYDVVSNLFFLLFLLIKGKCDLGPLNSSVVQVSAQSTDVFCIHFH